MIVLLDAGPLGLVTHPRATPENELGAATDGSPSDGCFPSRFPHTSTRTPSRSPAHSFTVHVRRSRFFQSCERCRQQHR